MEGNEEKIRPLRGYACQRGQNEKQGKVMSSSMIEQSGGIWGPFSISLQRTGL